MTQVFVQLDQIFVIAKHWLLGFVPAGWQPLVSAIVSVVTVVIAFPALFALVTWFERKGLGRMQNRYGPNRAGPAGLFQPIADAIKSLTKEDIVPLAADHSVIFLAQVPRPGGRPHGGGAGERGEQVTVLDVDGLATGGQIAARRGADRLGQQGIRGDAARVGV